MPPRHVLVLTGVLAVHALGLWLLQHGMAYRVDEPVMPAEILVEWLPVPKPDTAKPTLPQPQPASVRPLEPAAAPPRIQPVAQRPTQAAPSISPTASPTVVANPAASGPTVNASLPSQAESAAPVTAAASAAPPAAPRIELPSSQADYLNNPRPPYPALSKRLGEQGKVVLRVRIEPDGTASKAEIQTSSGYERLDQTAQQTVLRWRFVPGKRNGVAEAMWFNIPINFVLE